MHWHVTIASDNVVGTELYYNDVQDAAFDYCMVLKAFDLIDDSEVETWAGRVVKFDGQGEARGIWAGTRQVSLIFLRCPACSTAHLN